MNNQTGSYVHDLGRKSKMLSGDIGLCQCCPLSPILLEIFIDNTIKRSQGEESVWLGDLPALADDVFVFAPNRM